MHFVYELQEGDWSGMSQMSFRHQYKFLTGIIVPTGEWRYLPSINSILFESDNLDAALAIPHVKGPVKVSWVPKQPDTEADER